MAKKFIQFNIKKVTTKKITEEGGAPKMPPNL
jgi:hypothetical protein